MQPHVQTIVALLVVALAAVYLLRRARRFYLSMKSRSGGACGGCRSCGSRAARPLSAGRSREDGRA